MLLAIAGVYLKDQIFGFEEAGLFLIADIEYLIYFLVFDSHDFGAPPNKLLEGLYPGLAAVDHDANAILWNVLPLFDFSALADHFLPESRTENVETI